MAPKGPYRLCTVNTVPERAKRVVGRVIEAVKDEYKIIHVENAASTTCSCPYLHLSWNSSRMFRKELNPNFHLAYRLTYADSGRGGQIHV